MNAAELKSRSLPSLLSGTRRAGLPASDLLRADDAKASLKALSLSGQALRFERPETPGSFAVESWPKDERALLPADLRRPILRLLADNKCAADAGLAVALALGRSKLRPHPFDLPLLDAFVRAHAEHLGVTAQYWLQRTKPTTEQRGYFDAEELTSSNWTEAPLARRAHFLQESRTRDAAAGRELLLAVWPQEIAEARLRLLAALQTGLCIEDREFLESLQSDRAPRVRALALRLRAWLPGSTEANPALAECTERLKVSSGWWMKKHATLKLELPATVKEPEAWRWAQNLFAEVGLEELSAVLKLSSDELPAAAAKDEHLLYALATMASRERRFPLLTQIAELLPEAWGRMSECGWDELNCESHGERERWAEALLRPRRWLPETPYFAWSWLFGRMQGPLPKRLMEETVQHLNWQKALEHGGKFAADHAQVFSALCPSALRWHWRGQMDGMDFEVKDKALLLLEILERLEPMSHE